MTGADFAVAGVASSLAIAAQCWLTRRYPADFTRANFQGRTLPAHAGLAFVLAATMFYAFIWLNPLASNRVAAGVVLLAAFGFGALGLIDDLYGSRATGGFRGHFRALRQGKVTTGALKALGGGGIALAASWLLHPRSPLPTILGGMLIALTANAINLLDTRPGRALAGWLGIAAVLTIFLAAQSLLPGLGLFVFAVVWAAGLYLFDSRGRLMIGDAGANSLGGTLGVALAILLPPVWQGALVALLILFHAWTEKYSLSRVIENSMFLSRIDRKIGIR